MKSENSYVSKGEDLFWRLSGRGLISQKPIRPFTVGRKNKLFSSSVDKMNTSAVVYTMDEMVKTHGLNTYGYLHFLYYTLVPTALNMYSSSQ